MLKGKGSLTIYGLMKQFGLFNNFLMLRSGLEIDIAKNGFLSGVHRYECLSGVQVGLLGQDVQAVLDYRETLVSGDLQIFCDSVGKWSNLLFLIVRS